MKKTLVITGIVGLLMLAGGRAEATIYMTPGSATCSAAGNLKLDEIYDLLSSPTCFGAGFTIPEADFKNLYKYDGVEVGISSSVYDTSFTNTPQDPSKATITYVGGVACVDCYLVVKASNRTYYYDLSGWDGKEAIEVKDFGGSTYGAVSGVSLVGVPEPATFLLLATGLGVVAFRKRRQLA